MKINIMIGIVIIGALLFILIPIIIKYTDHNKGSSSKSTESSSTA